ncbi:malate synthase G [Alteromonas oceanisediminis]|uniref:malate synthase G n=1 Tax=Alteromonas oceanisediminis TaxID=2836180 RepID=UPI001BDA9DBC|nr:malate synthase G [Alteromonas oceanisediminis]MBT0585698.1 malate synthase G [Alteromonas oceanisediminis]
MQHASHNHTSAQRVTRGKLAIAQSLYDFIEQSALPGSAISSDDFWTGFESVLSEFTPQNKALLAKRDDLQQRIDDYHQQRDTIEPNAYKQFLIDIGYLVPSPDDVEITTANVDDEIATIAGPQLVVPINNARYALNAVNARWGSLYDALYGSDIIDENDGKTKGGQYNPKRGAAVVQKAREWLDTIAPLADGTHQDATAYEIIDGKLVVVLEHGGTTELKPVSALVGYEGDIAQPIAILIEHHGLHAELQFDPDHPVAKDDPTGLKDILLESALTTIMDCEDSVAAVDAEDKTVVYANWLGLMQGTLSVDVAKGDKTFTRDMNPDRAYTTSNGERKSLSGRSLMFVRNVGHLMQNDAILFDGEPVFEGLMDGVITSLIGTHDVNHTHDNAVRNSRHGSIYIVKPKMHGPEEVAMTNALFERIESLLKLPANTIKMGIMDEERRTSVNLKACIAAAATRVVFINTGFLDRTGDEIHTSMHAGAFADKASLKKMPWITAYEKANVVTGLTCGLSGKAQIGKGMWPIPDQMASMMSAKIGHPQSGANTAWVPSPTAATLHAYHYHQCDVFKVQQQLMNDAFDGLDDLLRIPLATNLSEMTEDAIQREVDNNVQGILGYVVRWVHQGIGCSKVPDINDVGLMEDRATLRISSQHLANWLLQGVISKSQVQASLDRMALLVDEQNQNDPNYIPMGPDLSESIGFNAACELIFNGCEQPSGYTEPLLHAKRLEMKAKLAN